MRVTFAADFVGTGHGPEQVWSLLSGDEAKPRRHGFYHYRITLAPLLMALSAGMPAGIAQASDRQTYWLSVLILPITYNPMYPLTILGVPIAVIFLTVLLFWRTGKVMLVFSLLAFLGHGAKPV